MKRPSWLLRYTVSSETTCQWFTFGHSARRAYESMPGTAVLAHWRRDGVLDFLAQKYGGGAREGER